MIWVIPNKSLSAQSTGMTLRGRDFRSLAGQWVAILYGIVAILGLTPFMALPVQYLPLEPPQFRAGLAIFYVVPTTLGVGVALTQVGADQKPSQVDPMLTFRDLLCRLRTGIRRWPCSLQ